MVIFVGAKYEYVVKEDENKTSNVISKDFVHDSLEGSWGICEAKWHDNKFIMP